MATKLWISNKMVDAYIIHTQREENIHRQMQIAKYMYFPAVVSSYNSRHSHFQQSTEP